jgi:hypothetical protein
MGLTGGGGDEPNPMAKEMRALSGRKMAFDNLPASVVAMNAAKRVGVNPSLFYASAFQEGLNKAIAHPDEVSEAYLNAKVGSDYPVDGFYNYGVDRFGEKAKDLMDKGYLPKDFDFKPYPALNEKKENVTTAAFRNNGDALTAKAAMLRDTMDNVTALAKRKGITLDEDAQNYFALVGYNAGEGNADKMLDAYAKAKDKKKWLANGDEHWQKIHKNIAPRLQNMKVADEIFNQK